MKLNNITADLTETELEEILIEAVSAKTGLMVDKVSFKTGTRTVGYGMNEYSEHYFEGATIHFAPSQNIKSIKP